jgi:SAM-dependent methyltransferase
MERSEGRSVFGGDPEGYARARPDYPERVFAVLRDRCGLRPGRAVLEIGPGPGKATRRLIELGADPLVAVEPDPRLAEYLGRALPGRPVEIVATPFEEAVLPFESFDLAVAATSFHWVEPDIGLAKVRRVLRAGGWWAMWWTLYGDESAEDAFHRATQPVLAALPDPRAWAREPGRPWFAADAERRVAELVGAGFESVEHELIRAVGRWDTAGIRALYGTFSPIARLPEAEREELLDAVAEVAAREFGGVVERPLLTALYTARAPAV